MPAPQRENTASGERWFWRIPILWLLLAWVFPLSHTWLLADAFYESVHGPLHVAWVLACGQLLALAAFSGRSGSGRRLARPACSVCAGALVSYAVTGLAVAAPPGRWAAALLLGEAVGLSAMVLVFARSGGGE